MATRLKKHRGALAVAAVAALAGGVIGHVSAEGAPYRDPFVPQACLFALYAADDAIADHAPIVTQYVEQRDDCRDMAGEQ